MLAYWVTFLAVAAVTGGNLLVRDAWVRLRPAQARSQIFSPKLLITVFQSWRLSLGLVLLLAGMISWSISLSVWNLDWGYLVFGLSYVITVFCAWWFIGETLTLQKLCGTIVIVVGMLLIAHSRGF